MSNLNRFPIALIPVTIAIAGVAATVARAADVVPQVEVRIERVSLATDALGKLPASFSDALKKGAATGESLNRIQAMLAVLVSQERASVTDTFKLTTLPGVEARINSASKDRAEFTAFITPRLQAKALSADYRIAQGPGKIRAGSLAAGETNHAILLLPADASGRESLLILRLNVLTVK